ncbi:MAG: transglutaminase domain-containing protein [Planctomycetes bacterium]|nr:transglutaminase domain-containing protein [Planctomycetota bacterium]
MKTLRVVPAFLLLIAFSLHAPRAQDSAPKPETKSFNFLIYYMGSRIGWSKTTVSAEKLDGASVTHEHEESWLQIKRSFDGMTFESASTCDYWYELDGRLIKVIDVTRNGKQSVTVETVYGEEQVNISETVDGGKPSTTTLTRGERTIYGDMRAWRVLKDGKRLKPGEKLDFWTVDDGDHAFVEQHWTVSGPSKRKLSDKSVAEGTEISIVKGGRASTLIMADDDMPLLFEDVGGFSLERTEKIPEPFKVEEVELRNTMDANIAILEFAQLTQLDIHFEFEHDDGEGVPPIADTNEYHDVVKYDKGYAIRMKSRRLKADFESPKYPLTDVPDDIKKYLEPTAMCQCDDETLKEVALKEVKRKTSALSAAKALMRFANKKLRDGSGETGSASAKQAYDEGQGDCTEHAALFVALARAAGLPARNVGGFVYACSPNGTTSIFGYHAWAEVWLGEWIPVDATVDAMGTSARYVQFDIDEPGETYGKSRSSRCIRQKIRPIIDAYELADGTKWRRKGAPDFEWPKADEDADEDAKEGQPD